MSDTITLLEWSSDPPTKPGVYRFRVHGTRVEFVEVYETDNSGFAFFVWGDKKPRYVDFVARTSGAQWQRVIVVDDGA